MQDTRQKQMWMIPCIRACCGVTKSNGKTFWLRHGMGKRGLPEKYNELMATREALENCGKENLDVGDRFILTYSDKREYIPENF